MIICTRPVHPENVWVEGTLRLEYGKSGIYNNNRLPAKEKKKEKKKKKKIPGIGRYPMGPTINATGQAGPKNRKQISAKIVHL